MRLFHTNFSSKALMVSLAVVFCFVVAEPSQAALINPPDPNPFFSDQFTDGGCTGCTFLASLPAQTVPGTNLGGVVAFLATLNTAVFFDPNNNLGGGLDFFYQLSNLSPCATCTQGPDSIGRFSAINFGPNVIAPGTLLVDIGWNDGAVPGFNAAGTANAGFVDRVPPGSTIGWDFKSPGSVSLTPGSTSVILEIQTNALHYSFGAASAIDGGTANFNTFQPTSASPTPEPASALLIGIGMLGLASFRRYSRRSSAKGVRSPLS
jgi:hypothetical protein